MAFIEAAKGKRASRLFLNLTDFAMLTGRESLIRLVGKRRRFLPNRHSLFSNPIPVESVEDPLEAKLNQCKPTDDKTENDASPSEIACPVCGCKIHGDNYELNCHLDVCLSRGAKVKLTQRTLLQLNFSPITVQNFPVDSVKSNIAGGDHNNCALHNISNPLPALTAEEESENSYEQDQFVDHNHKSNCKISSSSLPPKNEMPKQEVANFGARLSGVTLQTFIVGRRYADHEVIRPGDTICLLRDPHNVKDSNAIKVVSADSRSYKVLGFLSRELASNLSPLIDNYGLVFEGNVTSVPEHSLDVVPIQIVCQRACEVENEHKDETFKFLWENAQRVVDIARNNPPSLLKYQLNFCLILKEVLRSNFHLLTEDEKNFLEFFTSLSNDSQRLFIRLYTRKGPWFRMSSISYPEIVDVQNAVKELADKGYICYVEDANHLGKSDLKDILNILTVSELCEIWCMLRMSSSRGMKKQDFISSLLSTHADGQWPCIPTKVLDRTGSCFKISAKAETLMWRAERLFFLNGEQDLSAFLLVDMGKVKYPTYNCIISEPIFSNRNDLLAYEEAIEVAQVMDEALDTKNTVLVLRCIKIAESHVSSPLQIQYSAFESVTYRFFFTSLWVHSKVVTLGISFLEQERRYSDAIGLLKQLLNFLSHDVRRGYWTLRLSVDLEHLGYIDESLKVAENGLLDPWIRAGSRMALQRRVLRIGKPPRRWKVPSFSKSMMTKIPEVYVEGRPLNSKLGAKNRFYNEEGEQCGVEQLALHYYSGMGGGWQGVHTESGIWLTIFGLLMWDVIFADVPNVFYSRYQNAPLDMGTDSFYTARKSSIESHLQQIHNGMAEELLIKSWETHFSTCCRGVQWDRHSLDELRAAVVCVGGPCLASLCRVLAQDYQSWSSGMPDLLLWRFHGDYSGEAKLVEVKGPTDRLSELQTAWLLQLIDFGFMVEVCKVKPLCRSS